MIPCRKQGGIRLTIKGFRHFNLVLITNVAGEGDIIKVWVKGSKNNWIPLSRISPAFSTACEGAEVVFHMAAPDSSINNHKLHYSVNVHATSLMSLMKTILLIL